MGNPTPLFTFRSLKSFAVASIATLAIGTSSVQARTITAEEALQRVMNQSHETKTLDFIASPTLVYTLPIESSQNPGLYVFRNADNRGFMVLSADDEARALLGYSDNGTFDPENIPSSLSYWLECYTQEIATLQESSQTQNQVVTYASDGYLAPLLSTQWSQVKPYNNQCPQVNGRNTVTGCTATALAQVMKYFDYPKNGTGYVQYDWNGGSISSDLSAHTYDWDNMLDSYTGLYSTAQAEAVAQLMRDSAIAIYTDFGIGNSSASTISALKALVNNFDYDLQARLMERKFYSLSEWEEAIYNQLDHHGPVLYSGRTPDDMGHAFVCDGYSKGYFHINWGWGGMSDGFFALTALDPAQQGVGGASGAYNSGQQIVTNIYPNKGGSQWIELVSDFPFIIKESSASLGKVLNCAVGVHNLSAVSVYPVIGLAFVNTADNTTTFTSGYEINTELPSGYYFTAALSFIQNIPANLSAGNYIVYPAYKDLSGQWHILHVAMSQTRAYNMTVSGNTATFSPDEAPIPTVTASALLTPLYSYNAFKGSVSLRNPSKREFYGMVYPCFLKDNAIVCKASQIAVTLEGQEVKSYQYLGSCNLEAGEYQMCFCIESPDDPGSFRVISNKANVTVSHADIVAPQVPELRFADDINNVNASEFSFTFDATLDGGYYYNSVYLGLFPPNGGQSINIFPSDILFLEPGLNSGITLTFDISEWVEVGNRYLICLYARVNNKYDEISPDYKITIGSLNGVNSVMADPEEITSSTYFNLQGTPIQGIPTDSGVYIKVDTLSNGSVRTSKVLAK